METTTGPLGAGFSMGVGMALAIEHLAAKYNQPDLPVVDHFIYAIVSDGDLMEGVASEAASFAGHQKLGRLIYLYDDNHITIDGPTEIAFTEDRVKRFEAYGWHTVVVPDGNDVEAIDKAIQAAKKDPRPSLIACRTHIGFGLPTRQDKSSAHGEPPGDEELAGAKQKLGWPVEPRFLVPDEVREHFRPAGERGKKAHAEWTKLMQRYAKAQPERAAEFTRTQAGNLPYGLAEAAADAACRPEGRRHPRRLRQGAQCHRRRAAGADRRLGRPDPLQPDAIKDGGDFTPEARGNRYLRFGVREHAMGAILNGIALHGGLMPYGGTFMVFADYMRPQVRLAALMGNRVVFIFTHDSIGVGEDGPTHQPIEHLASLRAIPNLVVLRPADANETNLAWLAALERSNGPTALALTRQALPVYDREKYAPADGLRLGAYVMADLGKGEPAVILMASGSEVELIVAAAEKLVEGGHTGAARLVPVLGAVRGPARSRTANRCCPRASAPAWRSRPGSARVGNATSATRAWCWPSTASALRPLQGGLQAGGPHRRERRGGGAQGAGRCQVGRWVVKVAVACDHAGFPLKDTILETIRKAGHEAIDLGTDSTASVDYPDFAEKAGRAVQRGEAERAIVICGSGVGAAVAANKMLGVRAGLCHDTYSAHQCVEHDDVNVLALGGRIIGPEVAVEVVRAFLAAKFSGDERHVRRLNKVLAIERSEAARK